MYRVGINNICCCLFCQKKHALAIYFSISCFHHFSTKSTKIIQNLTFLANPPEHKMWVYHLKLKDLLCKESYNISVTVCFEKSKALPTNHGQKSGRSNNNKHINRKWKHTYYFFWGGIKWLKMQPLIACRDFFIKKIILRDLFINGKNLNPWCNTIFWCLAVYFCTHTHISWF